MDNEKIEKLQQMIDESNHIVFFGGAGVSTESHIPDFRSTDGLYHQTYKYPPEVMVSHTFYTQHTEEFYDFYKNKMIFLDAKPNKAHLKLAEMEQAGKLSAIVTQNIDGLHQAAGSKNVFELHGSVHRNYCQEGFQGLQALFGRKVFGQFDPRSLRLLLEHQGVPAEIRIATMAEFHKRRWKQRLL